MYLGVTCLDFLVETIWKSKACTYACFFPWVTSKGKIAQKTCLKRNYNMAGRCPVCCLFIIGQAFVGFCGEVLLAIIDS